MRYQDRYLPTEKNGCKMMLTVTFTYCTQINSTCIVMPITINFKLCYITTSKLSISRRGTENIVLLCDYHWRFSKTKQRQWRWGTNEISWTPFSMSISLIKKCRNVHFKVLLLTAIKQKLKWYWHITQLTDPVNANQQDNLLGWRKTDRGIDGNIMLRNRLVWVLTPSTR